MKVRSSLNDQTVFAPVLVIAFFNFMFLFIVLIIFYSFFAVPAGYEIRMPIMATRNLETGQVITIRVSAENVLFLNDKVVTFNDLKRALLKINIANNTIYVQVDSRASMARVGDIWEMCKGLGIAQVKVSTF